jgi:putative tryptophan/tyrosine transport system substrate-binding protein
VFVNPSNPNAELNAREAQDAARTLGLQLHVLNVSTDRDIDAAFATLIQRRGALSIDGDPFFTNRIELLAALTGCAHRLIATTVSD